jgi:hypothetical protein
MKKIRPLKDVLGFEKGYITIFKGDTYAVVDWFRERPECRFHTYWGWYVISTEEVPTLPAGIEAVQLRWEDVSYEGEDALKSETAVKEHLATLLYDPSPSEYQGEVGDRIEETVVITKKLPFNGPYGPSTIYSMKDDNDNVYTWFTSSAADFQEGTQYRIRGTIKEHKMYRNEKQTVLNRVQKVGY